MAGTFLTALSCIHEHQLREDDVLEALDGGVGLEASTMGLERMRCVKQPTGDKNNEEAKDEEKEEGPQRGRFFADPEGIKGSKVEEKSESCLRSYVVYHLLTQRR